MNSGRQEKRITVGIALGGGGARGLAHIGVLRELSKHGIDCDVVVGTSAGALVGAVYAADRLEKLDREVRRIRITDIPLLLSPSWSLSGLFSGRSALDKLGEIVGFDEIEKLPKQFAAVAVDLERREVAVLSRGDLRRAIRASIAIPGLLTPESEAGRILVDGAILEPVPVATAREMGADFVIAVDLFSNDGPLPARSHSGVSASGSRAPRALRSALSYLRTAPKLIAAPFLAGKPGAIEVMERTLALSQATLTQHRLRACPPDVLIQPALGHTGLLDFHKGEQIIRAGRDAARKALPEISSALGFQDR